MLGDRFLVFLMPSTYNVITPIIGPISYVTYIRWSVKVNSPKVPAYH